MFCYVPSTFELVNCAFWGDHGVSGRCFLPVILKLGIYIPIPDFKWQSSKDNFHNLILGIDKIAVFGTVNLTMLITLSLPQRGW
jgi:hypothetical protein